MMIKLWTREAAKAGPADTYKGRYRIRRDGDGWCIVDIRTWSVLATDFDTARAARKYAEEAL